MGYHPNVPVYHQHKNQEQKNVVDLSYYKIRLRSNIIVRGKKER